MRRSVSHSASHLSSTALHARPTRRCESAAQQPARLRSFSPLLHSSRLALLALRQLQHAPSAPLLSRRLPLTLRRLQPHPHSSEGGGRRKGRGCSWASPASERGEAVGGGVVGGVGRRVGARGGQKKGPTGALSAAYLPSSCLRTI